MKAVKNLNLKEIVVEQEGAVLRQKRDHIGKLVNAKIIRRERLKEQIAGLEADLEDVEATLEKLRAGDWTVLNWKPDSEEL